MVLHSAGRRDTMNFVGTGKPYSLEDVMSAALLLECDVAAIFAVIDVESAGVGFGPDNRPLILFEPHIFYRRLRLLPSEQSKAVLLGVAYEKWGTKPYPRHQSQRYAQLETAMVVHKRAALESASWGLGQVMGFNYAAAGYDSVYALVEGAKLSEGEQLMAMSRFIKFHQLHLALQTKNWVAFASGYNGPGYAKHKYDEKLAKAYERHSKGART